MIVKEIIYSRKYIKELRELPKEIQKIVVKKEKLFKNDALHPSLRMHGLHGRYKGIWSISITGNYRIIFKREDNGDIHFMSVGKHDIYRYL